MPQFHRNVVVAVQASPLSTLDVPDVHLVTFREELAVTEEYLSIEQVRFGPRLTVSLSVSPEASEAQVPRFLLQPIVENAISGNAFRPGDVYPSRKGTTIEIPEGFTARLEEPPR